MTATSLDHVKLLSLKPEQLVIGTRPIPGRVLLIRLFLGLGLILLGSYYWYRSPLFTLALGTVGLGVALPQNPSETLILNKRTNQVTLLQHRYFISQLKASCPLSEVTAVQLSREATDRYAEGIMVYRCQVYLTLKTGDTIVVGDYSSQCQGSVQSPKAIAQKMVQWIQDFLDMTEKTGFKDPPFPQR